MHVNHKQLTEALRLIKTFTGTLLKHALPIFRCAELRAGLNMITLRKRDDDAETAVDVPCTDASVGAVLSVPIGEALKALKAVKADAKGMVEIDPVPDRPGDCRIGPLVLASGVRPADLPAPSATKVRLRPVDGRFLDALRCVAPAICQDTTRQVLCGAWIDECMVGTDGHRLHLCDTIDGAALIDHDGCGAQTDNGAVLPRIPLQVIRTILVIKKPTETQIGFRHFTVGNEKDPAHALDGAWQCASGTLRVAMHWQEQVSAQPDWREIMPGKPNVQCTLNAKALLAELALLKVHQPDSKYQFVKFTFGKVDKGSATVSAQNDDNGQILTRLLELSDCRIEADGEVSFSVCYLVDAIEAVGGEGEITLSIDLTLDPHSNIVCNPVVITPAAGKTRRALIMPVRP